MDKYLEIIVQTMLAFFTILFITRLLGRQQISQLTFHEYINGITFGSIAATLATDLENSTMEHFTGLVLFGILTLVISLVTLKSRSFRKVVEGEPILVIQNGKILENNLKRARYNVDEFNMLLRQKECYTPENVEYGILESNGYLNIFLKNESKPVTLGDLDIKKEQESIPTELIIGGQIIYENLRKRKLNGKDLMKKLKEHKINRVSEVMYASISDKGEFYVDKYDDHLMPKYDFSENNKGI